MLKITMLSVYTSGLCTHIPSRNLEASCLTHFSLPVQSRDNPSNPESHTDLPENCKYSYTQAPMERKVVWKFKNSV